MNLLARAAACILVSSCLFAQEHQPAQPAAGHGEAAADHGPSIGWKWANFVLLGAALGYLIGKNAPAFFRSRTDDIQRGMAEAARIKKDADARVAEVERRLASLENEIAALRSSARDEMAAEIERMREETTRQLARIKEQAEQEMSSALKAARLELKKYSAELAVSLAEQKVRSRLTPAIDDSLVDTFVDQLRRQGQPGVN